MDYAQLNQVLALIEEWVAGLDEDSLPEHCRVSGRDFFSYMKSKGVDARLMARLIIDKTGYNPAQLWTVNDANLLRDSIQSYEQSMAATKLDESHTPQQHIRHFWS